MPASWKLLLVAAVACLGGAWPEPAPWQRAGLDAVPAPAPAVGASRDTEAFSGLAGPALLEALRERAERDHRPHDYTEARKYLFSVADRVQQNGRAGVVDAYSLTFVPGSSDEGGDYRERGDQNGDGWVDAAGMNVEHVWPQFFFDRRLPMRSDLHNLLPTFSHPNEVRSRLPFGEVPGRPEYSNRSGGKSGGGMFEPPDAVKGRVARALLYFVVRYRNERVTGGDYNDRFWNDRIPLILRWNREHPPAPEELRRNALVERFQGNRNPFVDEPALAERIGEQALRLDRQSRGRNSGGGGRHSHRHGRRHRRR